ncbi:MAG: 50S ribosomal protein L4 [Coriobacteriia bacterium]|nr:50S ribosomal protein L4 [Coriobacteriia bacterium]MCL2870396.1 50S ribosomal protein L4 [Coriobacteriia bacterium]
MTTLKVKDKKGAAAGTVKTDEAIFAIEPNLFAVHQVVRSQLAAARAGTHSTKTRGLVRGGGRKPWRQKGTGRARQGTIRAPQWKGGGVVFGPTPRNHGFKVPNKVVKLAMKSAISAKVAEDNFFVVDALDFDKPSTKEAIKILDALGLKDKKITIILGNEDTDAYLSLRNVPRVRPIFAFEANTYDIVDNTAVLATKEAVTYLGEVLN